MKVDVTEPSLESFVRYAVAAGRFGSPEEVVTSALTLLRAREQFADLRAAIAVGIVQADAGMTIPWDVGGVCREAESRLVAEAAAGGVGGP